MTQGLDARYGRTRRSGAWRVVLWVLGGVVAAAFVAWLVWAARFWANPVVTSGLVSFGDITDDSITVVFDINRDPGTAVTCEFELTTLGRLDTTETVSIPAGPERRLRVEHTFTSEHPVAAKLLGCTAPGQERPR